MVRFGPLSRLLLRGIGFVSKRYFEGMIRHGRIQILLIIACNYGNIIMEEKRRWMLWMHLEKKKSIR